MKQAITLNNCTEIGYLKKTHGIGGELLIFFNEGFENIFEEPCFFFLEIDGLPVPFFAEEIELRDETTAVAKFKFVNSKEVAQQYVGAKVYVETENLPTTGDTFHYSQLKGFMLSDATQGQIGPIEEIDDYNGNFVMTVKKGKTELLFPLNEDLITAFDATNRTIELDFAQGLFNLQE